VGGEDKMAVTAPRRARGSLVLAERYASSSSSTGKLNILDPVIVSKATDHIAEMIALIGRLIAAVTRTSRRTACTSTRPRSPAGTRLNPEPPDTRQAARVEVNPNACNTFDFALWRAAKPDDLQQWDSPWGKGNPGWHIECSAMSMKYLGETFDMHSGGEDHLFPHHECEIAQSEAATGKPFVRYWMHTRFLRMDSAKMAKSAGGFLRLSDIEERGFDPLAFRLLALGTSYRKGVDFTWESLQSAQTRLDKWRGVIAEAWQAAGGAADAPKDDDPIRVAFATAIADDLTPPPRSPSEVAIGHAATGDAATAARALGLLFDMDRVLGLSLKDRATAASDLPGGREPSCGASRRATEGLQAVGRAPDEPSPAIRDPVKDTKDGQRWERGTAESMNMDEFEQRPAEDKPRERTAGRLLRRARARRTAVRRRRLPRPPQARPARSWQRDRRPAFRGSTAAVDATARTAGDDEDSCRRAARGVRAPSAAGRPQFRGPGWSRARVRRHQRRRVPSTGRRLRAWRRRWIRPAGRPMVHAPSAAARTRERSGA
jgi:cysteinyl-tRNA synthetase